jgi:Cu(I)/Ag(I) efflux system membrane fusion protein/cobalt-zinc-cadmium efflux system membrane fusion protein
MLKPLLRRPVTVILPIAVLLVAALLAAGMVAAQDAAHRHGSASAAAPAVPAAPLKTLYTCGMHPEVIADEPGNCPKCGMKLVPMDPDRARTILEARGEAVPRPSAAPATAGATGAPKERKILYWRSSMNPAEVYQAPGKDSMGMDLAPVYADETTGGPSIRIDPVTEQNMGLRLGVVRMGPLDRTIRTVGTVEYDEQGLATVTTKVNGWVEKVQVDLTGTQVHAGDPLFDFYAPELYSAQEEFLQAARDAGKTGGELAEMTRRRLESARARLRLFDIADDQIEAIRLENKVRKALTIVARQTGIVTEKMIVQGDYLPAGQAAYKIADLSTVWVIGRVFENDLPYVKLGQEAQMKLDYLPGRVYRGRVTYVYPYLKPGTREVPVRMEFHNPGYDLKPGMYATVMLRSRLADRAVLVPAMAVIDTGERRVAFVQRAPGKFEPRKLTTGARNENDELQVLGGLAPGETVVVSGQFLLDSESRLREATLKMLEPGLVNTTTVLDKTGGGATTTMTMTGMNEAATTQTETQYVCPMPSHADVLYAKPGNCPLCGMKLAPVNPWQEAKSPVVFYTCPMPEDYDVRADRPGKCPKCGMTLIPVTADEAKRYGQVVAAEKSGIRNPKSEIQDKGQASTETLPMTTMQMP